MLFRRAFVYGCLFCLGSGKEKIEIRSWRKNGFGVFHFLRQRRISLWRALPIIKGLLLNKEIPFIRKILDGTQVLVSSKKWVDGLIKKPIVRQVRQQLRTPIASLWVLTAIMVVAAFAGFWLVADVKASSSVLTFVADKQMLANGEQIKSELEQKLTLAQIAKAGRLAEEKRLVEEEAARVEAVRLAEEACRVEQQKQARRVAVAPRSQSSSRSQTNGTIKTGTYYTPSPRENGGWSVTATGEDLQGLLNRGEKIVASNDYSLGTEIKVDGVWYRVADRMAHSGKVDFLVGTNAEARAGGRHQVVIEETR